ncbi:Uncharacterised protein [Legionella steigerwaltii]|uniref:Transmembrane protein n=1 Tax=Legionella steigerwaltii TaxID=460 RepID=A0A378LCX5_9GAMM|nr:hypothetical protein [Legionella steigerwaltii]KTD75361.1 hypothetical protein Lstg_2536 [Legionella steigerwaltii]STY23718.1 Uncharacterised protein [Legionella steigerwaltii]
MLEAEKKPPQPRKIPKLITLAAQVINKTNPHLFFTLYNNKTLPHEIENQYVNPPVQKLVKEHEEIYRSNDRKRKRKVDNFSSHLEENNCYRKCASLTMAALGGGIHLSTYYILRASGASSSVTFTFLTTIPATIIVMACFSPCAVHLLAKGIANCVTPRVSNEEIDLNKKVADIESQRHKSP